MAGLVLVGLASGSQAAAMTGGNLAEACAKEGDQACTLVVQSFMDGYTEGAGVGVAAVYMRDPSVALAYKDVDAAKLTSIQENTVARATCLRTATQADVAGALLNFVKANPEAANWPYGIALAAAIKTNVCK